jgi:hypothetical protein
MLLALALYASTAHENTPHYDLDLLYHDGKAHRLDQRLRIWRAPSPRRGDTRLAPPRARTSCGESLKERRSQVSGARHLRRGGAKTPGQAARGSGGPGARPWAARSATLPSGMVPLTPPPRPHAPLPGDAAGNHVGSPVTERPSFVLQQPDASGSEFPLTIRPLSGIIQHPTLAIDLPLKALVWEDANGKVWLSYNSAEYVLSTIYGRHGAPTNREAMSRIDGVLAAASDAATQ